MHSFSLTKNFTPDLIRGSFYNPPMIFSLAIYAPPSSSSSLSAYRFAEAAIASGHRLYRIFFYHEGVHHGAAFTQTPQDEFDLIDAWCALKKEAESELCICIAASVKRGIFNQDEAERYELDSASINSDFNLVGLGDLIEAAHESDRVITFGDC